jgi:hypothetical protein
MEINMDRSEREGITRIARVFLLLGVIAFVTGSAFGASEKTPLSGEESGQLVVIVKGRDSKGELGPLTGVVVNVCDSQGSQHQQKTTAEGRAVIKGLARGKARVQVIAPEWEPFGKDYDLTQEAHEFSIEMKERQAK